MDRIRMAPIEQTPDGLFRRVDHARGLASPGFPTREALAVETHRFSADDLAMAAAYRLLLLEWYRTPCPYAILQGAMSGDCGRVDCGRDHRHPPTPASLDTASAIALWRSRARASS